MRILSIAVLLMGLDAAAAWACPSCQGQTRANSELFWLGCLIAVPVLIGLASGLAIRSTMSAPED